MKTTIKALSKEIFFLYWKGHLQPNTTTREAIKQHIENSINCHFASLEEFTIKSNYCDSYNVEEFLK